MNHFQALFYLLIGGTAAGCLNAATMQTAHTLDKAQNEFVLSGGYFTVPEINEAVDELTEGGLDSVGIPIGEFMYRRGIVDNFDMGVKLTIIGTLALDAKYQFVDTERLAVSAGLGAGTVKVTTTSEGVETSVRYTDILFPVYTSFDPTSWMTLSVVPKYNLRLFGADGSGFGHMAGSSFNLRLGKRSAAILEATYLKNLSAEGDIIQYMSGFSLQTAPKGE